MPNTKLKLIHTVYLVHGVKGILYTLPALDGQRFCITVQEIQLGSGLLGTREATLGGVIKPPFSDGRRTGRLDLTTGGALPKSTVTFA